MGCARGGTGAREWRAHKLGLFIPGLGRQGPHSWLGAPYTAVPAQECCCTMGRSGSQAAPPTWPTGSPTSSPSASWAEGPNSGEMLALPIYREKEAGGLDYRALVRHTPPWTELYKEGSEGRRRYDCYPW